MSASNCAYNIGIENLCPLGGRLSQGLSAGSDSRYSSVVDQNIQSTVLLPHFMYGCFDAGGGGDIDMDCRNVFVLGIEG
jgi:hypothetical protein